MVTPTGTTSWRGTSGTRGWVYPVRSLPRSLSCVHLSISSRFLDLSELIRDVFRGVYMQTPLVGHPVPKKSLSGVPSHPGDAFLQSDGPLIKKISKSVQSVLSDAPNAPTQILTVKDWMDGFLNLKSIQSIARAVPDRPRLAKTRLPIKSYVNQEDIRSSLPRHSLLPGCVKPPLKIGRAVPSSPCAERTWSLVGILLNQHRDGSSGDSRSTMLTVSVVPLVDLRVKHPLPLSKKSYSERRLALHCRLLNNHNHRVENYGE